MAKSRSDKKKTDEETKPEPHIPSLDEKLYTLQTHLLNLHQYKVYQDIPHPADGSVENGFNDKVQMHVHTEFTKLQAKAEDKTGGLEGLDDKTTLSLNTADFKSQLAEYQTQIDLLQSSFTACEKKIKSQSETLLSAHQPSDYFEEVSAKDWIEATNGAKILQQITKAKDALIEAEKDGKKADASDAKLTDSDKEERAVLRKSLLDNQIKKLNELEKEAKSAFEKNKFAEDILSHINSLPLTDGIPNPSLPGDAKANIKGGRSIEEMNKDLVKAQLIKLYQGEDRVWANVDGKADAKLSELENVAPGKFRLNTTTWFDQFFNLDKKERPGFKGGLQNLAITCFALTGVGALYMLYTTKGIPTFTISKEGGVGWSSKDEFNPAFLTVFQGKNPGKPMYLTLGPNTSDEYIKKIVQAARNRKPVLVLMLSDKCKANFSGPDSPRVKAVEELLTRKLDTSDRKAAGGLSVGDEEKDTHLHTNRTPRK